MTERVFVLESDKEKFSYWKNIHFGLAAQLEALGIDGESVEIERLTSAADLRLVANAVNIGAQLPARALVLANIVGSDLHRNPTEVVMGKPVETPEDFVEGVDPGFIWEGDDCRPLDPYGRLIAARLIKRHIPSMSAAFTSDVTRDFGGSLHELNRMLTIDGEPRMSIVDATRNKSRQYPTSTYGASFAPVSGADIVVKPTVVPERTLVDMGTVRYTDEQIAASQIGAIATLLSGKYPQTAAEAGLPVTH